MEKTLKVEMERELEITLEAALPLAEPGTPTSSLAERIYDSEPRLNGTFPTKLDGLPADLDAEPQAPQGLLWKPATAPGV